MNFRQLSGCLLVALFSTMTSADDRTTVRRQAFDSDPQWEGVGNRLVPARMPLTRQHFGWRDSHHAGGKTKGELGGRVQRSSTMARYAMPIQPKTLNDRLHASGKFSVTQDEGGSNVLFGWFNETSRGWRTPNSLAFRIDGNGGGYWVFYEYGTKGYLTAGGGAFEGPRYQTTKTPPFKPDGTSHAWSLDYDPAGAGGNGLISFKIDDRTYELPLDPGHKADGATFDRFGIWNAQTTGGGIEVFYDDVDVDGVKLDFSADPKWEGIGNDVKFVDRVRRPLQDFGFCTTHKSGGKAAGEIGGILWRDDREAWYADKVGTLSLADELTASGTVSFNGQGSDSGIWIGWFGSESKKQRAADPKRRHANALGVRVEGPSRIGHYFNPGYLNAEGEGHIAESGPVIRPDGKVHRWKLHYVPGQAGVPGSIELTFDDHTQKLEVRPEDVKQGSTFDRFGLFNVQEGGHYVELYIDDLQYTAEKAARP